MSSNKSAKNAKSRGHASCHEARSEFAGSGNSAHAVDQAGKSASLGGGVAASSLPVGQATAQDAFLTAAFKSPPPPPKTPYPGPSSSVMQNPPLPKDDQSHSSTADAAVGALGRGADAHRVRDRSPLRPSNDDRAELLAHMDRRFEAIQSSFVQSMQGFAHSLSAQQQQQQQHFEFLVAQGSLSG